MPTLESVLVHDAKTGGPVPGALVVWWNQAGQSDARTTDGSGFCNFGHLESGGITMTVSAAGYHACNLYKQDDATPFTITLEPSAAPFCDVAESGFVRPVQAPAGPWPQPVWWYREDGRQWFMAGWNCHLLLPRLARGEDFTWLFDEMDRVGANTLQVIGTHLSQWKIDHGYHFDPHAVDYQGILARAFDLCAARKKRLLINALADCQGKSVQYKAHIWEMTLAVAKGRWNAFVGKGNEDGVNGWHIDDCRNPNPGEMGGVPVSQGNNGGGVDPPHEPFLDFIQWENRPDPRKKTYDDAGAGAWEMYEGYSGEGTFKFPACGVPVVVGESAIANDTNPDEYGDFRWTNPADYLVLGLNIGANFSGGFMGSSRSLEATPNGPGATQCFEQFFRGFWRAAIR
jgi:hypothetical protein